MYPCATCKQAGRYQAVYRKLAEKHPSFRERSETPELIVEITLQPWEAFQPDGVILFSDILTPLPAVGIPFEIDNEVGPVLEKTVRSRADLSMMHEIDLGKVSFTGEALKTLRSSLSGTGATLLGFVGSPFTLGTYIIEGQTSRLYKTVKTMALKEPELLLELLDKLAVAIADYACYQVESGAQVLQIFDSWGGQLPPAMWETISKPSIAKTVELILAQIVRARLSYANAEHPTAAALSMLRRRTCDLANSELQAPLSSSPRQESLERCTHAEDATCLMTFLFPSRWHTLNSRMSAREPFYQALIKPMQCYVAKTTRRTLARHPFRWKGCARIARSTNAAHNIHAYGDSRSENREDVLREHGNVAPACGESGKHGTATQNHRRANVEVGLLVKHCSRRNREALSRRWHSVVGPTAT